MVGTRKQLGAWYTPAELVTTIVDAVITPPFVHARRGRTIRVVDPACGDGRLLVAAAHRLRELGATVECVGCDLDPAALATARRALPEARFCEADALALDWGAGRFDLVIGNPPYLSQLADATTRGGASSRGGGPYADVAAEFLALGGELVEAGGGCVVLVLPQSMLASRDAAPIRGAIGDRAHMVWSWWSDRRVFDAQVYACVVAFEFGRPETPERRTNWSHVITDRQLVPELPADPGSPATDGRLGDRATGNANFRDEYYGLVGAVGDHHRGPPLVTSGLIDPARCWWGDRPVTFARQRYSSPRVDLDRLDDRMHRWAERRLVPKVLVANQTSMIEAVCDPFGEWLPGVPVLGVYPRGSHWDDAPVDRPMGSLAEAAWEIAAVLTSPFASAWCWHQGAGTGLSARSIRLSPVVLGALPWPSGDLRAAVAALRSGDVRRCGREVGAAYGRGADRNEELFTWWSELLRQVEARQTLPA